MIIYPTSLPSLAETFGMKWSCCSVEPESGPGGGRSNRLSSVGSQSGNAVPSSSQMTGFGDPYFEGTASYSSGGGMNGASDSFCFQTRDAAMLRVLAVLQSRIQGFGGSSSNSVSSVSAQSGNGASSSSRMTGFGNPRFEGASKMSSSAAVNVTSPKAILGAISNAAGFSNPTRQQLERNLSNEKVMSLPCSPLSRSDGPLLCSASFSPSGVLCESLPTNKRWQLANSSQCANDNYQPQLRAFYERNLRYCKLAASCSPCSK